MKKILIISLFVVAVPLYLWDSHILFTSFWGKPSYPAKPATGVPVNEVFQKSVSLHFVEKGRSPFSAFKEPPKPAVPDQSTAKRPSPPKKSPAPASPPKITITGIMWNPTNPIAMVILPDGSSSTVKTGQTIGTLQIRKIEKNRICVAVEGTEFWIAR